MNCLRCHLGSQKHVLGWGQKLESCTGTRICPHPQPSLLPPSAPRPHWLCPRPRRKCPHPHPITIPVVQNFFNTMVTLSFCLQKNHLLVFSNSKIMFTWHIFYTSNSASSQFTVQSTITSVWCWMHWKLEDQLRSTTATYLPAPTVLPWTWSPSPLYYHEAGPHPCSVIVNFVPITAE